MKKLYLFHGRHFDLIVDINGNSHIVWEEKVDQSVWEIFYANDIGIEKPGKGNGWNPVIKLSSSQTDSQYRGRCPY